jgi:hypothetical protein
MSNWALSGGGAIMITDYCNPHFEFCEIRENICPEKGGGIHCNYYSEPKFLTCTIVNNETDGDGGGFYCEGNSLPEFTICTIDSNDSGRDGGGIHFRTGSHAVFAECWIGWNTAYDDAGGVFCSGSSPIFTDCVIHDNEAIGDAGGGVFGRDYSSPQFTGCTISGNQSGEEGGGMRIDDTDSLRIDNCVFTGNRSGDGGGGLALVTSVSTNTANVTRCTFSGNFANQGGGFFAVGPTVLTITNTVIWGNCAGASGDQIHADAPAGIDIECCNVDSTGISTNPNITWVADNVFVDPKFCGPEDCGNAPTTGGDYTISRCSPCSDFLQPVCGLIGALDIGCGADPAPVGDLVIDEVYPDAVLHWSPVTTTTCGALQDVDYYLVYYSEFSDGPFFFHGFTADTTYTHFGVVQFSETMYYEVEAYIGTIGVLEQLSCDGDLTRRDIKFRLNN